MHDCSSYMEVHVLGVGIQHNVQCIQEVVYCYYI